MAAGMEDTPRSNSSSVLVTGNATVFSRVRALGASRAVISASGGDLGLDQGAEQLLGAFSLPRKGDRGEAGAARVMLKAAIPATSGSSSNR